MTKAFENESLDHVSVERGQRLCLGAIATIDSSRLRSGKGWGENTRIFEAWVQLFGDCGSTIDVS